MVRDMTRAISRPSKRSRTMATDRMREAAAPTPCTTRAAISVSKLGATAARAQPAM